MCFLLIPHLGQVVTSVDGSSAEANAATAMSEEPPPPGTSADRPPLPPSALVRRETALVHRVMALLGEADPASSTLISLLAEAEADGVDVPRWLDLGRSSNRGRTPLMEAAMQGQTVCVAALAEAACAGGRGLNARNERGRYSALHYACYYGAAGEYRIFSVARMVCFDYVEISQCFNGMVSSRKAFVGIFCLPTLILWELTRPGTRS